MTQPPKLLPRSVRLYFSLLIISTGLILYGTLFPADYNVPDKLLSFDKVIHIIMFGAWTFFYGLVRFLKDKFNLTPVFLVGTFFGLMVEILQHLLPTGRSPELLDFVADLGGTGLAVLLLYFLSKKIPDFNPEKSS